MYGKGPRKFNEPGKGKLTEDQEGRIQRINPGILSQYKLPNKSADSARRCYEDNFRGRKPIRVSEEGRRKASEAYKDSGVAHRISDPLVGFDRKFDEAVEELLSGGGGEKTPGYPWHQISNRNSRVINEFRPALARAVKERIEAILEESERDKEFRECRGNPALWYHRGLRDPHRVFKKGAPEPVTKKYGRIVNGESITDQLVHRILFSKFLKAETDCYPFCPNMKGVGFTDCHPRKVLDRFEYYTSMIEQDGGKCVKSDVSGWEKGFSEDCADAFCDVFKHTCLNWNPNYEVFLNWWKWSLLTNLCIDDDGYFFALDRAQGMKSGNLITTSANGVARAACAFDAGSKYVKTNGDDCVEWTTLPLAETMERYNDNNVVVRDFAEVKDGEYHFCSHVFFRIRGRPACYLHEVGKTIFDAMSKDKLTVATLENYACELVDHPDKAMVLAFIKECENLL